MGFSIKKEEISGRGLDKLGRNGRGRDKSTGI